MEITQAYVKCHGVGMRTVRTSDPEKALQTSNLKHQPNWTAAPRQVISYLNCSISSASDSTKHMADIQKSIAK